MQKVIFRPMTRANKVLILGCTVASCVLGPSCAPSLPEPSKATPKMQASQAAAKVQSNNFLRLALDNKRSGNRSGYAANLERARKSEPENQFVLREVGRFYVEEKRYSDALTIYRQLADRTDRIASSMEKNPVDLTAWGEVELKAGSKDLAKEAFQRACDEESKWNTYSDIPKAKFPNSNIGIRAKAHYISGIKQYSHAQYELAAKEFDFASKLQPTQGSVFLWTARTYRSMLRPKSGEALAIYRELVKKSSGPVLEIAKEGKSRLEYYWKTHHTWNPFDNKTGKEMHFNPTTRKYEVPSK